MNIIIIQSHVSLSHAPTTTNEITDNNSHTRHDQHAITSEGGHASNATPVTSEGAYLISKTISTQLVPTRLLRH
jgi:hypothetical protein